MRGIVILYLFQNVFLKWGGVGGVKMVLEKVEAFQKG